MTSASGYDWRRRPSPRNFRLLPSSDPPSSGNINLELNGLVEPAGFQSMPVTAAVLDHVSGNATEPALISHSHTVDNLTSASSFAVDQSEMNPSMAPPSQRTSRQPSVNHKMEASGQQINGESPTAPQQPAQSMDLCELPARRFVPLALSLSKKLMEPIIIIQNEQFWEDEQVMATIQKTYWDERGSWKRFPTQWRIWPWKVLYQVGLAKVCPAFAKY
jgi:hypothetical protein